MNENDLIHGPAFSAMQGEKLKRPFFRKEERDAAARLTNDKSHWDFIEAMKGFEKGDGLRHDNIDQFKLIIELLKLQGINCYRFSLLWDRIMNADGSVKPEGIELYKQQVQILQENGIEPMITLHHFDLPENISWLDKDMRKKFMNLAEVVLREFIPLGVKYWIPINEASVEAGSRYFHGFWAPFKKNVFSYIKAMLTMAACSRDFYKIAHRIADQFEVPVIVMPALNVANFKVEDENPNRKLKFAEWLLNIGDKKAFVTLIGRKFIDAIGIQFYWRWDPLGRNIKTPEDKVSSNGDILNPGGIYEVIKLMYEIYGKPIYITEWGADIQALNDHDRRWYIEETYKAIEQAINDGYPVMCELNWSVIQNWEIIGRNGGGWDRSNFGTAIPVNRDIKDEPLIFEILPSFEALRMYAKKHGLVDDFTDFSDFAEVLLEYWLNNPTENIKEWLLKQLDLIIKHLEEVSEIYHEKKDYYFEQIEKIKDLIVFIYQSLEVNVHQLSDKVIPQMEAMLEA